MNFKITSSAKMLSILAVVTGAKLNFKVEGDQLVMNGKEAGTEGAKEWQNATYLSKFIREYAAILPGTMESRIKTIVTKLRENAGLATFRTMNNTMRRSFDDASILPHAKYQAKFFYEGKMIGRATHGANAPLAPKVKEPKVKAEPVAKKATPAPKTPAAPAKKVKATTKPTAKATTKPAVKATKPATADAKKKPTARKPKATPVASPVADNTPDVVLEIPAVIDTPIIVETPAEVIAEA